MRTVASAALRGIAAGRFAASAFSHVEMGPPDPILGLGVAFNADKDPNKVNLGVGVYRGDDGKPYVLPSVREAEKRVFEQGNDHEYAPISGHPGFVANAQKLAFGKDSKVIPRVASAQALSGTGALRVAADFLERFSANKKILVPNPTWGNHMNVFRDAGLKADKYTYFDAKTNGLDFDGMIRDISAQAEGTIILLHACAHNPTGFDPSKEQWQKIVDVVKSKNLLPLIDMAYQGFASGDPTRDAYGLRLMADSVPALVVCQSFAKSFGLYGQRCGAVHLLCASEEEKEKVLSQLKILIRPMYSNPPLYGARVVDTVLSDPQLVKQWELDLQAMADRMNGVRRSLVDKLAENGSRREWGHITKQIGMMAFTGLNKDQVATLKSKYHIYMTDDGRAAVTGLNSRNVEYVAKAFHDVTK
jgi:aspartate aminotransferase